MGKTSSTTIELEAQDLLAEEADGSNSFSPQPRSRANTRRRCSPAWFITLVLLLVTNTVWYWSYKTFARRIKNEAPTTYYGTPITIQTAFDHDWVGLRGSEDGRRYREDRWEGILPKEGGSVALTKDFARQHHLENASPTKENDGKMHYLVAGYHQLHCAYMVRDALYYLNGTTEWHHAGGFDWDHILHCVDAVRQGLACFMDPTLIPLGRVWPGVPNGQNHVCTNKDALYRFAEENGHPLPDYEKLV